MQIDPYAAQADRLGAIRPPVPLHLRPQSVSPAGLGLHSIVLPALQDQAVVLYPSGGATGEQFSVCTGDQPCPEVKLVVLGFPQKSLGAVAGSTGTPKPTINGT